MDWSREGIAELRSRVRQQEVVAELGQRALESDDLDELLNDATVAVAETLDTEYCRILELLPSGDEVFFRQGVGWPTELVGSATVPTDRRSLAGHALRSGEPILVDDLRSVDVSGSESEDTGEEGGTDETRTSGFGQLASHEVASGIGAGIGSVEDPWGVLETHATERREFTEHDADFVQRVADVLASAIANQRTARRHELFRTLLDRSTDSVFVIDSETGRFLDVNETACRRRGYARKELLDLAVMDLQTEVPDRAAWHSLVEEVAAAEEITFSGTHRRKDGTTYPVEVNATYVELDRAYVLAIARDTTERRARERELEQYRALTEAANDVIITIDERSVIRSVNPTVAEVFGYDQAELIGESLTALMPDEFADRHREGIERYLETGEKALNWDYLELPGRRADGTEIPLAVSFSEVTVADGRYFTGIIRDITERKEIQRRLEASNERLEQFAYVASHDLQEPLRMVSSYLQLIERRYGDELDEDGREFLEFAVDGAERMVEMIDGLLAYSRVETQGDPLTPVDLDDVLDDVLADLQFRIEESDAEITAESLPRVEGDVSQLRQLFQNLLSNAIEYSDDEPPRIHITAERSGTEWTIAVRDEGIGIDPADQERIFDVFQRLHSQEEHGGTGIGLALCRRIVERHGGEIQVESQPDAGTTFLFTLPTARDDGRR